MYLNLFLIWKCEQSFSSSLKLDICKSLVGLGFMFCYGKSVLKSDVAITGRGFSLQLNVTNHTFYSEEVTISRL